MREPARIMSQMYSWLVRTTACGFLGTTSSRNRANVPDQDAARWPVLNSTIDLRKL
jgi:hypothetical protein